MKKSMRKKLQAQQLTARQKAAATARIAQQLQQLPEIQQARCIGVYYHFANEVDLDDYFHTAQELAQIAYPYFDATGVMHFYTEVTAVEETPFGVRRPQLTETVQEVIPDLLLVPSLAVNRQGYRLGYGGGYYDRYLTKHPTRTIAVSFAHTVIDLPFQEAHDVPMDMMVTEAGITSFRSEAQ